MKYYFLKTIMSCLVVLLSLTVWSQSPANTLSIQKKHDVMNDEKDAIVRLYTDILNNRRLSELDSLISPDYSGGPGRTGLSGFKQPIVDLLQAFPDAHWEAQVLLAGEDKVFVTQSFDGTQKALFQGFAATGKHVIVHGMGIYEFKDGRITHSQIMTDRLAFLQQLGILPQDLSTLKR